MGHSRQEKAQSQERILRSAAGIIRKSGPDGINIATLMQSASLTHGAFYSHFLSRSALITATIERALDESEQKFFAVAGEREKLTFQTIVKSYLSRAHSSHVEDGCAIACLAIDAGRGDDAMRSPVANRVEEYVDQMARLIGDGPEAREESMAAWCTMIGAIIISRLFNDSDKSDAILKAAKQAILGTDDE